MRFKINNNNKKKITDYFRMESNIKVMSSSNVKKKKLSKVKIEFQMREIIDEMILILY